MNMREINQFLRRLDLPDLFGLPDWTWLIIFGVVCLIVFLVIILLIVKIISNIHGMSSKEPKPKKEKPEKGSKENRKKHKEEDAPKEEQEERNTSSALSAEDVPPEESEMKSEPAGEEKIEVSSVPEVPASPEVPSELSSPDNTADSEPAPAVPEEAPVLNVPETPERLSDQTENEVPDSTEPCIESDDLSDEHLTDSVDFIAGNRKALWGKSKKKPQKISKHKSKKNLKKKAKRLKIPKTVQQSIPYNVVYPENGIIEIQPGVFTKSYWLEDINYQIAKEEEQFEMFMKYGQLLNSFDSNVSFEITINQKNINMDEYEEQTMLPMKNDGLDEMRVERNNMLKKKLREGKNGLIKEKYLTVTVRADSLENAETTFARLDTEVMASVKKIGQADASVIPTVRRLEILHDIYNIGWEGAFGNNVVKAKNNKGELVYDWAPEKFRFDIMKRMGLTTKDMVGPTSFTFRGDFGMVGDKYFRALFLKKLPSFLQDNVLQQLTNTECNMITSLHYQPIDNESAQKMIHRKMTNINANMVEMQKKAYKAGYSSELISPELRENAEATNNLLEDVNKKNQKLFYTTIVIVHFSDSKEQLDNDTKIIQGIGRGLNLEVKKLTQQQENGLNTALPLGYNQLSVSRVLTTESAGIFMPFVNQELNDRNGGMYYGNNAVSHNLIMLNRRNSKNGNGFIFGTPGSGKSMSAKQEMNTVLLSTDDTVVVIDPEGEYYPMAEMLGGEVIRIAAGANVHINPFDIDMDTDSKDDPMAMKSDFIVSLCETAVAGQYGLAPTQRSIIDRCVRKVYEPYLASFNKVTGKYDKSKLPTMRDFYNLLRQQAGYDAMQLADGLEIYVTGSLNLFAHRTNVEYKKRFVVFDIKDVGATMKTMALQVVLDHIWNRMVEGRKEGRYTWFYIDEIYLLFKTQSSAEFLRNLYKRARKYFGLPTGITQNVSDLLEDDTARTMISNCEFIMMLNQAPLDRAQLAELLNISETQLGFVTNSNPGEGLIYNGRVIVPFVNKLPKDTKEYMAMTTKPDEVKKREQQRNGEQESENDSVVETPA